MKKIAWKYFTSILLFAILALLCACGDDEESLTNDISIRSISPESPAALNYYQTALFLDRVFIEYDYNITHNDGARIWIEPYTGGNVSPNYVYSSSTIFKGKGTRAVLISVSPGEDEVHVDQLKILIRTDAGEVLRERFMEVDYKFQ